MVLATLETKELCTFENLENKTNSDNRSDNRCYACNFPLMHEMISITKTTPSCIFVLIDNNTVKVSGESFVRGNGSPDFIIDIASIKTWDKPFDTVAITESDRAFIVDYLLKELTARKWYITAE